MDAAGSPARPACGFGFMAREKVEGKKQQRGGGAQPDHSTDTHSTTPLIGLYCCAHFFSPFHYGVICSFPITGFIPWLRCGVYENCVCTPYETKVSEKVSSLKKQTLNCTNLHHRGWMASACETFTGLTNVLCGAHGRATGWCGHEPKMRGAIKERYMLNI